MFLLGPLVAYITTAWLMTMSTLDSGLTIVGLPGPCDFGLCFQNNIISYGANAEKLFEETLSVEHSYLFTTSIPALVSTLSVTGTGLPLPSARAVTPMDTSSRYPHTPSFLPHLNIPDFTPVVDSTSRKIDPPTMPQTKCQYAGVMARKPGVKVYTGPKKASFDGCMGNYICLIFNLLMPRKGLWPLVLGLIIYGALVPFEGRFRRKRTPSLHPFESATLGENMVVTSGFLHYNECTADPLSDAFLISSIILSSFALDFKYYLNIVYFNFWSAQAQWLFSKLKAVFTSPRAPPKPTSRAHMFVSGSGVRIESLESNNVDIVEIEVIATDTDQVLQSQNEALVKDLSTEKQHRQDLEVLYERENSQAKNAHHDQQCIIKKLKTDLCESRARENELSRSSRITKMYSKNRMAVLRKLREDYDDLESYSDEIKRDLALTSSEKKEFEDMLKVKGDQLKESQSQEQLTDDLNTSLKYKLERTSAD